MKKNILILALTCIVFLAFSKINDTQNKKTLPENKILHIGIVVHDIEKSIDKWVTLLDLTERPKVSNAVGHEDNPTHYRGNPTDAKAKLAFMTLENIKIELIEPFGDSSHWKEHLDAKGESVHHIAFEVKGIGEHYINAFKKIDHPLLQQGGWNGGEYSYMDGSNGLGVTVELIEHYNK